MTYTIRPSKERGHADHGWLKTSHTFSFADYYDPKQMGFRSLRVINEDRVLPGEGFPSHPHKNMEILTYVIEGEIAHKDSLGNSSVIRPNEFQLMHAGTGIVHSEYNPSKEFPVHFLQIWIKPNREGLVESGYQQKAPILKRNAWTLIASENKEAPLEIYQDVQIYCAEIDPGADLKLHVERYGWLQVVTGNVQFDDMALDAGDGVSFETPGEHMLKGIKEGKLLFFDLA